MHCPKCNHEFELVIKEISQSTKEQQVVKPVEQPVEIIEEHTRLLPPSNKPNKITDDEFLRAQRILSMAAQGRK